MQDIRQVIYASRLVTRLSRFEEASLLAVSQRNNRRQDLTGCLVCTGDHFFQLLEGQPDAIASALLRIIADPRHADVHILLDRRTKTRRCAQWSMAYVYAEGLKEAIQALADSTEPAPLSVEPLLDRLMLDSALGAG